MREKIRRIKESVHTARHAVVTPTVTRQLTCSSANMVSTKKEISTWISRDRRLHRHHIPLATVGLHPLEQQVPDFVIREASHQEPRTRRGYKENLGPLVFGLAR